MSTVISNYLNLGLVGLFYICAIASGLEGNVIWQHTLVGFVAFVIAYYANLKGFPAGVAKMISVAFLWFGIKGEFAFVFFAWGPLAAVALCLKHFGKPGSSGVPFLPFAVFSAIIVAPKYAIWALPM